MAMTFASALPACAADGSQTEEIKHAVRVLKDIDTDMTKEWAVSVLRSAADNDSVAYAMNVLGLAYMAGAGVEGDTAKAIVWLEKAGRYGYNEAWHNLGMIYKDGKFGIGQNFTKAYNAFMNGASVGSIVCKYDAGFMLYKGLGCRQDYAASAALFEDGANADHSPSLYMLGLCYRNGYGVPQDTARASFYLGRSAALSFTPAMEEMYRPYPENCLRDEFLSVGAPERMPEIRPEVNDTAMIYGTYGGFVAMYDWSGRYLLGEKPVEMSIVGAGPGKARGRMVLSGDTIAFSADVTSDGRLLFTGGGLRMAERYTVGGKVSYRMESAVLDIWDDRIAGRLSLYSLRLKEPERPMYMELSRIGGRSADGLSADRYTRISASPNPFSHDFMATFELADESEAQVRIFDRTGRMAYATSLGTLEAGRHTVSISPDIMDGTYVLNIRAGRQVLRAIIVKNGGVR